MSIKSLYNSISIGYKLTYLSIIIVVVLFIIVAIIIIVLVFMSKENLKTERELQKAKTKSQFQDISDYDLPRSFQQKPFIINYSNNNQTLSFLTEKDAMIACRDIGAKLISQQDIQNNQSLLQTLLNKYQNTTLNTFWIENGLIDKGKVYSNYKNPYRKAAALCFGQIPSNFGIFS